MNHCNLFIAHISAPIPNGPSLSYTMFSSYCNTLLINEGFLYFDIVIPFQIQHLGC
jgi:hypothetical protein